MSHHIVEARNLGFSYPDGTVALKNISFRITHGESVAFIGANGAGKSTLLMHLNGSLLPLSGEVRIGGCRVTGKTLQAVRRTVGMVLHDPDDQLFMPTAYDDVAFGPLNLGLSENEVKDRVELAMDVVGVRHLADKAPYHLSAGEKKRVSIATVLSMSPDILVMDEPTNGLDPFSRRQMLNLLGEFSHTKIFATHDLDFVIAICDRVIVMHEGEIKGEGTVAEIFNNLALLSECRLERPLSMQGCRFCGA